MTGFIEGLIPEQLPLTPAADSAVTAMVWGGIIAAIAVFPTVTRLWRKFLSSLTRHDNKLPAAERTLNDRLCQIVALSVCCLMWGILLYCVALRMRGGNLALGPGSGVALIAAGAALAVLIQFISFRVVGFAFATTSDGQAWTRALTATLSMLGYWMLIPALGALLFPARAYVFLWIGIALYLFFRIFLWIKCFRIFYDSIFSILYFFLYICTLETVPLLTPVVIALFIC